MRLKKLESIFAIILLIAFFLPWTTFGGLITVTGYNFPIAMHGFSSLASAFDKDKEVTIQIYYFMVYLIPILAITILAMDLKGGNTKIISIITGSLLIITFLKISSGRDLFTSMGIGAYLTIIAAIGLLLVAFNVINLDKKKR